MVKDFGAVTVEDNGFKIKVNIKKKVEWEPGMVIKALNAMDEETAKHYAKSLTQFQKQSSTLLHQLLKRC